jgi:predicted nucleotidyltransferase component of viral defense system
MNILEQMLTRYKSQTTEERLHATREVMQQITLAGLYRGGFFDKAAFYGGTCLRVFYGLQRFSEDMDFSLLHPDKNFDLENYFTPVIDEFKAYGKDVLISKKEKKTHTNVESAFLKDNTAIYNLKFNTERTIRIKIEVDINPPSGFATEHKLLLLPFSFMPRCYIISDLYAGKMHAFLFRNWKNRVKGRDWYDFEWYVRNNVVLNFNHLCQRIVQLDSLGKLEMSQDDFKSMLKEKITHTNINKVKDDVSPFINNQEEMAIWSTDYFIQLVDLIRFE